MRLPFVKMHGLGNDYVFVNGFEHQVESPETLARVVSDRHRGVGGDGLILLLRPTEPDVADIRMRIFNADGAEAEMCGNGIRCLAKLACESGLCASDVIRVETGAGVLRVECERDANREVSNVTVDMGVPTIEDPLDFDALVESASWVESCGIERDVVRVSTGNPHVVIFCSDPHGVRQVPLEDVGPSIERHLLFPDRTNVHFVGVNTREEVTMRTWERGSGATRACGTGAVAVCVAGAATGRTDRHVTTHLPGGDLEIAWDEASGHVFMSGPAVEVFRGEIRVPEMVQR